jgi:hypothetical protein
MLDCNHSVRTAVVFAVLGGTACAEASPFEELRSAALGASSLSVAAVDPDTCPASAVSWRTESNSLSVSGAGVLCTISQVAALSAGNSVRPPADRGLFAIDAGKKTWYLASSLVVEQGATLHIHGAAAGGDTDELRLRSDNQTGSDAIVYVRADYGSIDIAATHIQSWDEAANGPDTETDSFGRAYIHVRSFLDEDGTTARASRMDIRDSELSYLGSHTAESYGVTWKVKGEPMLADGSWLYDHVGVYGDVLVANFITTISGSIPSARRAC